MQVNHAKDLFDILFLNTTVYGYIGILAYVTLCLAITKKVRYSGWVVILVNMLMITTYLDVIQTTPALAWNLIILAFGTILTGIVIWREYH